MFRFRQASKIISFSIFTNTILYGYASNNQCKSPALCDVSLPDLPYDYNSLEPYIGKSFSIYKYENK